MKPRVFFLLNSDRFMTEPAEDFGIRSFLFERSLRSPLSPDELIEDCLALLEERNYDPTIDYIALTGPVIQLCMFFAAVFAHYGEVKSLIFDARSEKYSERTLDVCYLKAR